jgi:phosphatidate cytidylyltransferase
LNNLTLRSFTGLVFAAIVLMAAYFGSWSLTGLFLIFAVFGLLEFLSITSPHFKRNSPTILGIIGGALLYSVIALMPIGKVPVAYLFIPLLYFVILMLRELFTLQEHAALHLGAVALGWIYVIVPFALLNTFAHSTGDYESGLPIGFFLILWLNDSGAYFIGKFFGKRKLFPAVSPNKTWEGLAGGVAFAVGTGYAVSYFFDVLPPVQWMVIAALIAVFANVGDLFESHIKRTCGVKDSGTIIPGHGGALDRFDGLLFALPVATLYLQFIYTV